MKVTLPLSPLDLHPVLRGMCHFIMLMEAAFIAAEVFGVSIRPEAIKALGFTLNWQNEPWRVMSHVLVHGDPWHMVLNIIPMLLFGDALALIRGMGETTIIILISILAGVTGFVVFGLYPAMIGASAISFGLAAACLVHWSSLTIAHRLMAVALVATILPSIFWWTGIAWEAHVVAAAFGAGSSILLRKLSP